MNSYAGIDWATRMHALWVVDRNGETLANEPFPHSEPGLEELISRMHDLGVCRVPSSAPTGFWSTACWRPASSSCPSTPPR